MLRGTDKFGIPVYEPKADPNLDDFHIDPNSLEQIIQAKLPIIDDSRQEEWLSCRAMGFGTTESCQLTGLKLSTVVEWRDTNPGFALWEKKALTFLQHELAGDIFRAQFMRNMYLVLRNDATVLKKSQNGLEVLDAREFDYLRTIRKHYTPQELMAVDKAIEPEESSGTVINAGNVTVVVDGSQVSNESARRAAALSLLEQFTANQKYLTEDTVEGELVRIDNGS